MNLPELIENIVLDRSQLSTSAINQVVLENYTNKDFVQLIRIFLTGIGNQHQVSGDIVYHLSDIAHSYTEFGDLTPRQQVYVLHNIINNWHQIGLDMRCQLGL
jgi:hypothetical protein